MARGIINVEPLNLELNSDQLTWQAAIGSHAIFIGKDATVLKDPTNAVHH